MERQLPLPVGLRDGNTLESFVPGANAEALAAVRALAAGTESLIWLWGPPDSGRTHLLEAVAEAVTRQGAPVAYLAADALAAAGPAVLAGLGDSLPVVIVDDVDRFAEDSAWEEAFFHLFNALRGRGGRLLLSASSPPGQAGFRLADLRSRFSAGLVIAMTPPDDALREAILVSRAAARGLQLAPDAARWLLAHGSRRLGDLVALLAELDRASMVHQRRLTLPFVRRIAGSRPMPPG